MTDREQRSQHLDPAANSEETADDEARRIAEEQTDSASPNADEAGKDWEGRDVPAPKPE